MEKKNSEVKDVTCDVQNCAFNNGNCSCMAGSINVGTTTACASQETCCSTFKHK